MLKIALRLVNIANWFKNALTALLAWLSQSSISNDHGLWTFVCTACQQKVHCALYINSLIRYMVFYWNKYSIGIFVHSGTGLTGCRTVRHSGIYKSFCWWWLKGSPVHVQTACSGEWYTLHVHRQLLMVLFLPYDIEKSYVNAGMPECRRKS